MKRRGDAGKLERGASLNPGRTAAPPLDPADALAIGCVIGLVVAAVLIAVVLMMAP